MAQLAQGTRATRVRILTHKSFRRNRQRTFSVAAIVYCLATCLCSGRTAHAQVSSAPVPETQPLIEIVVTARRMALVTATELKRNSDTIVDSIVADEAGKLPDTSVTEVLQRVPGVTIARFANLNNPDNFAFEGTSVQIRGLAQVEGMVNGQEVNSANGGVGLNFNEITPELMAAVDVYKQGSADLIEGGIGGAIDLRTHMPFDYQKQELDLHVATSYGDFSKKLSPQGSILATKRWDTPVGEFGALIDVAYSELHARDSNART